MMKSISSSIGSFSIAGISVFQMTNFNPFTVSFWATLTGIFFWAIIVGIATDIIFDSIKTKIKWHGTGQIHSEG